MRRVGLQQPVSETTGIAGGIVRSAVAADSVRSSDSGAVRIVRGRASVTAEPGIFAVVEYVEGFGAEFKIFRFGYCEVFQQRHIKVGAPGIAQDVPAGVTESKPGRSDKYRRIVEQGRITGRKCRYADAGIACDVGIRGRCGKRIGNPSIVVGNIAAALVINAERCPAFNVAISSPGQNVIQLS